jgi:hypothetical protein
VALRPSKPSKPRFLRFLSVRSATEQSASCGVRVSPLRRAQGAAEGLTLFLPCSYLVLTISLLERGRSHPRFVQLDFHFVVRTSIRY